MSKKINTKRFRPLADEYADLQRQIDELKPVEKRLAEIRRELLAETKDRCSPYQSAVFQGTSPATSIVVSACAENRRVASAEDAFDALVARRVEKGDLVVQAKATAWRLVRFRTNDLVLALGKHDALRLLSDVSPGCRKVTVS